MTTSNFIVDVSESDFEYEVLAYSQQIPVIVDFWADWCGPCKVLGPILEKITQEAQGDFRLAKVNVDQNTNLALRYAVRSIPVVKAFKDGKMISEFIGVVPESRIREFIRQIAPTSEDLNLERGASLLSMGKSQEAEKTYRLVLENAQNNPTAILGLARSLLLQGKGQESLRLLIDFPPSRELQTAQLLIPLARSLSLLESEDLLPDEDPFDPVFINSLRLVKRGHLEAAMDGLLDILRGNKRYRESLARQVMIALLDLSGENNPVTREYRNELSIVLF